AVSNLNIELVEKILEKGEDPNQAIEIAIESDSVILLEMLLEAGAKVEDPKFLHYAFQNNNSLMAEKLFENGCRVSHEFSNKESYLHAIARMEDAGYLMESFISFGLNVNKKNNLGETPLHLAVQEGNKNSYSVLALLKAGADPHAKTNKKKRVFKYARGIEIKNILADYGADE
ncbi:MAG: ankyrin repeat domain-containing protein, partial [Bacteroidia bacterium]|nr:ankyrin repeat domain-containing protein [Bacteroidia bacterium]